MIKVWWLGSLLFLGGCDFGTTEKKEALTRFEGVAILGASEGMWFTNCPGKSGKTCGKRSLEKMCALSWTESAGETALDFLRPLGLESEGYASLALSGIGRLHEGDEYGYGHVGMSDCKIEFERIDRIALIENPFAPPPSP